MTTDAKVETWQDAPPIRPLAGSVPVVLPETGQRGIVTEAIRNDQGDVDAVSICWSSGVQMLCYLDEAPWADGLHVDLDRSQGFAYALQLWQSTVDWSLMYNQPADLIERHLRGTTTEADKRAVYHAYRKTRQ